MTRPHDCSNLALARLARRLRALFVSALVSACPVLHAGNPTNPILFVTQVPIPEEVNTRDVTQSFMSIASPFSNHLADTLHAGRGGSLWVRFNDGQVVNLLAAADWSAIPTGQPAFDAMAVRNPAVNWTATKAIFSMTFGKPGGPADTTQYSFQLYEITLPTQAQLSANVKPVLTKVANQPAYNNVFPTYAQGGKIVFSSDRPYNGQTHLVQREEYLSLPTVSGLWALDPTDATSLQILHHAPSGAFYPFVDSAGRVIFTNWDHLSRDTQAVTDSRPPDPSYSETFTQTANGSGNFVDETAAAAFTAVTLMGANTWDVFPEPRNFDRKTLHDFFPLGATGSYLNGNAFNLFMPWMISLDGTGGELLNHVGRHEVGTGFTRSFNTDANLMDFNPSAAPTATNGNYAVHKLFTSFFAPREDPLNPGSFYGADGPDLGTHGAGRISRLSNAGAGVNPDSMLVSYVTDKASAPTVKGGMNQPLTGQSPATTDLDLYRTPVPLSDGNLIAPHVAVRQTDYNTGSVAFPAPVAGYSFRLRSLKPPVVPALYYSNDVTLTPGAGIPITTSYYVGTTLVTYNGPAWELDPVEVVSRAVPAAPAAPVIHPVTAAQFAAAGVHIPTFKNYLAANNAALSVSFDVTKRDRHDKQQPYNLRVSWSGHQTTGTGTTAGLYDIAWLRFFQADLRRGYALNTATPIPGRRVVATPLHDTMSQNVQTAGAPAGAVRIGDDGSVAAVLPAGKAMTWDLLANDAAKTSQVKERFWITFQRGEIRTCANCHGINTADQAGAATPTNPPAALADLLAFWRSTHPSGTMQFVSSLTTVLKNAGNVLVNVMRSGGSTGPVSVNFATANGTALVGVDFTAATGTLSWADGDTAARTISVPLLNNPVVTANKNLSLTLSAPTYGTLGASTTHTVTLIEPSPPALTLDADGNGGYDALTDGVLIYRYLVGLTGTAHTTGAVGNSPVRSLSTDITLFLSTLRPQLDVDGDMQVLAATDGLIVLRYLLGLRGVALTAGITGVGPRPVGQIKTYIQSLMP